MHPERHFPSIRTRPALLLATAGLLAGNALAADEWPPLKPGLWESTREMTFGDGRKNPPLKVRHCVDPGADMQKQRANLVKGGCRFSAVVRTGNEYRYSADCRIQGLTTVSRSVLTTSGDSAYEIRVESEFEGEITRELLRARRVGACPK